MSSKISSKTVADRLEVDDHEVVITNPDEVLFPGPGYTKRDLVT